MLVVIRVHVYIILSYVWNYINIILSYAMKFINIILSYMMDQINIILSYISNYINIIPSYVNELYKYYTLVCNRLYKGYTGISIILSHVLWVSTRHRQGQQPHSLHRPLGSGEGTGLRQPTGLNVVGTNTQRAVRTVTRTLQHRIS